VVPSRSLYEITDAERDAIVRYARQHPRIRHRELAWRMLDDGVCAVSPPTVYRVLREAGLVYRWQPKPKARATGKPAPPARPDEQWQSDIRYTKVNRRNYYLLSFIDVHARYIVHHARLTRMDGQTSPPRPRRRSRRCRPMGRGPRFRATTGRASSPTSMRRRCARRASAGR
jgi:hypothetical protein